MITLPVTPLPQSIPLDPAAPRPVDLADTTPPVSGFDRVRGLYVHVPFCAHKCHYCDFYSITRQAPERMTAFVDRILSEADQWTRAAHAWRIETVFFGGGTPTLLPVGEMTRLIAGLKQRLPLADVSEWTVEVNPATADLHYFDRMRTEGVDRVSIGAQSFNINELQSLERHHDPDDVPRAVELARRAGIERQSVDLIFAIPGQTKGTWQHSLDRALATDVEHLSCYGLTYEPNTPLAVRRRLGRVEAVAESLELDLFTLTRRLLDEAGRPGYEISNFARPGRECRHNLNYWAGNSYVGLGPSAASHLAGRRWRNAPHLGQWERGIDASTLPMIEFEQLSPRERSRELAWLNLRRFTGILTQEFKERTGLVLHDEFSDVLEALSRPGLIDVTPDAVRLTEAGWPLADSISSEFLAA